MGLNETKIVDQDSDSSPCNENNGAESAPSSSSFDSACGGVPVMRDTEAGKDKTFKQFVKKDLDFLIGNLEKLPESASKLFSVAKLYLTAEFSESSSDRDFTSLFQTLPATGTYEVDVSEAGTQNEVKQTFFKKSESLFVPLKKSAPLHYAQTYIQWKSAHDFRNIYSLCLPKRRTVYLQPIDEFPDFITSFRLKTHHLNLNLFETLQGFAQIFFSGLEVLIRPPVSIEKNGWQIRSRCHESTNKMQYCVNDIHPSLQCILPSDGVCIVGIIWTDIYPEGYNFVLGEASLKHQTAVISFGRFEPLCFHQDTHSDVINVDGILLWKLLKSMSHELCHVFGLEHCTFFHCAMNESSSVSDALSHPLFLCPVCLRKLQRVCGFDVLERYQQLRTFLSMVVAQLEHTSRLDESLAWLDMCIEFLNS